MATIAGVDDAGRGPVIGPLVIAGVSIKEDLVNLLSESGVRDSKTLTPHRRVILYPIIKELAEQVIVEVLYPKEVDEYVHRKRKFQGLNLLEAEVMARILCKLNPEIAYIDASDVKETRFGQWVIERLDKNIQVVSEHHADKRHPIVAASSIVAKVERDSRIEKLKKIYGDFGSGYVSDNKTLSYLRCQFKKFKKYPPIVRHSWKTLKKLETELAQSKLA